jgi:hypothetical protein
LAGSIHTHENFHSHLLWRYSDIFGYKVLSGKLGACRLLGVADISQDLASAFVRAKSDCLFLVFGAECHYYFIGGFFDSWVAEENIRFYDEQRLTSRRSHGGWFNDYD